MSFYKDFVYFTMSWFIWLMIREQILIPKLFKAPLKYAVANNNHNI